jgi:hypothetical protein
MATKDEQYMALADWIQKVADVAPENGGAITIETIVQRLESKAAFPDKAALWPTGTKERFVRRVLEWSMAAHGRRRIRAYIGVDAKTGKVVTPRPRGIDPVQREAIFEPKGLDA